MILSYWGLEQPQSAIAKQLETIEHAGTPASRVKRLASAHLEVTYTSGKLSDLEIALNQRIPPIVFVNTSELSYWSEATAHAVVLLGIEQSMVTLHDPAKSNSPIQTSLGDFQLAWDEMSNLYALLRKV
jgi:hypothetical protein